jgi:hypothetical protein
MSIVGQQVKSDIMLTWILLKSLKRTIPAAECQMRPHQLIHFCNVTSCSSAHRQTGKMEPIQ